MSTNTPLYPWSELYNKVLFYTDRRSNRRMVRLSSKRTRGLNTTYARYLFAAHLGHWIPKELEVDHINNDPTDDRIENYQLLTPEENISKFHKYRISLLQNEYSLYINKINANKITNTHFEFIPDTLSVNFNCNLCNKQVTAYCTDIKAGIKRKQKSFYCSRECQEKAQTYTYNKPDILKELKKLTYEGKCSAEISRRLNLSHAIIKKYKPCALPNGRVVGSNGSGSKSLLNEDHILLINEYARQGMYPAEISRLLKIDRSTVKKYVHGSIPNGRKEANRKLIKPNIIDKINKHAREGKSCHQISKLLSISDSVVKKYVTIPLANGLKEAHPYILKQEIIDRINSFGPDINNDTIARLLKIDHTSVKKYRTTEYEDGRKPGTIIKKISKIPVDLINKINLPEYVGLSSKVLAKKLNIDRSCIERYRHIDSLDSETLFKLIEITNYRKRRLTLRQIRGLLLIGKNTMSKYAYYINRPDVQEQLKEHAVESYSYYDVLNRKKETTGSPSLDYLSYAVDSLSTYTAYDEYQINALKAFYDSNKDYTIYATVETTEDDIFLVISGTR